MQMERILFPVDYSERCSATLPSVRHFAKHFHSEVTLLHVIETGSRREAGERETAEAAAALHAFRTKELAGFRCHEVVMAGDPGERVAETAESGNYGLVMMPTRGHGAFRRLLLGSATAKVLNDTTRPVWTGAHIEDFLASAFLPVRRILCAVDLGQRSPEVLRFAVGLRREFHALLCAGHAIPWTSSNLEGTWAPDLRSRFVADARQQIEAALGELGANAEIEIVDGPIHWGLADLCRRWGADVMVLGRTRAGEGARGLGSNLYGIITHAPCPVISV